MRRSRTLSLEFGRVLDNERFDDSLAAIFATLEAVVVTTGANKMETRAILTTCMNEVLALDYKRAKAPTS